MDEAYEHHEAVEAEIPGEAELHEALAEIPAPGGEHGGPGAPRVIDVSGEMFLWTLVTFLAMAYVLTRIAWRPILDGLDKRESYLRQSVENAQQVEQELAGIESRRRDMIAAADEEAKDIVSRGRRAGMEAERVIQDKAREEAGILMENAQREITAAQDKAAAQLKRESVDAAISLAGRLVVENLDTEKNRALTDRLIDQL